MCPHPPSGVLIVWAAMPSPLNEIPFPSRKLTRIHTDISSRARVFIRVDLRAFAAKMKRGPRQVQLGRRIRVSAHGAL